MNDFLFLLLAAKHPQLWEIWHGGPGGPGGPVHIPKGAINIEAALMLKSIASKLKNKDASGQVTKVAKLVFSEGKESMGYDDDGWDKFPPGYRGFHPDWVKYIGEPIPSPGKSFIVEVELNPQPLPPGPPDKYYGAWISLIAEI